jgi:rubrerythrin
MPDLKQSQTYENLKQAFIREAEIKERYHYFAKIAEFEGRPEIAKLILEMAEEQGVFVGGHLDLLRTVQDPLSGLQLGEIEASLDGAIASEVESCNTIYPEIAHTARAEGFPAIASWFESLARSKQACLRRLAEVMPSTERQKLS